MTNILFTQYQLVGMTDGQLRDNFNMLNQIYSTGTEANQKDAWENIKLILEEQNRRTRLNLLSSNEQELLYLTQVKAQIDADPEYPNRKQQARKIRKQIRLVKAAIESAKASR